MIVYTFIQFRQDDLEERAGQERYFATQREAVAAAKVHLARIATQVRGVSPDQYRDDLVISKLTLVKRPKKELVLACLNRFHFLAGREFVVSFPVVWKPE